MHNSRPSRKFIVRLLGSERYENRNTLTPPMDDTDVKILNLLRGNSRMKNTEIARQVSLTERAVRARIEKLTRERVIKKFTVETSPIGVEGIVLIDTNVGRTTAVKEKARQLSDSVFECSGEYDVAVRLRADSLDQLNKKVDELRGFPGVLRTSTLIKLIEG
jgi:DNA-binding Lrp family transcriptional regulator